MKRNIIKLLCMVVALMLAASLLAACAVETIQAQ